MEYNSIQLIKQTLPSEWLVEETIVDYGIDLKIEIFENIRGLGNEALGEFIFAQVKSVNNTDIKNITVKKRRNVAKGPLTYSDDKPTCHEKIDVFTYSLDTSTILTIQSMSSVIPVFLLYVTLDTQKIYFLNLTDYIDKILIPKDQNFANKKYKTLYIPVRNEVTSNSVNLFPLRFAAVRMKLYAFFHEVNYQKKIIIDGMIRSKTVDFIEFFKQIIFLIDRIKLNDIWDYKDYWSALENCYDQINILYTKIQTTLDIIKSSPRIKLNSIDFDIILVKIKVLWRSLVNLGNMFEEIIREKHLPSVFAEILNES